MIFLCLGDVPWDAEGLFFEAFICRECEILSIKLLVGKNYVDNNYFGTIMATY